MYLVDMLTALKIVASLGATLSGIGTGVLFVTVFFDDVEAMRKTFFYMLSLFIATLIIAIGTPTRTAMYAGAAQYVVEATEVDDTLLSLKRLIDQKIEEATQ
jgi:hypothetical protein